MPRHCGMPVPHSRARASPAEWRPRSTNGTRRLPHVLHVQPVLSVPGADPARGEVSASGTRQSSTRDLRADPERRRQEGARAVRSRIAPSARTRPPDPEIRFLETTQGLPVGGRVVVVSGVANRLRVHATRRARRALLAQGTGQPVLTTQAETTTAATTDTGELARVSPAGEQPARPGEGRGRSRGNRLKGEIAPLSIVVSEAAEARVTLPRLAAVTLLVAGAITFLRCRSDPETSGPRGGGTLDGWVAAWCGGLFPGSSGGSSCWASSAWPGSICSGKGPYPSSCPPCRSWPSSARRRGSCPASPARKGEGRRSTAVRSSASSRFPGCMSPSPCSRAKMTRP